VFVIQSSSSDDGLDVAKDPTPVADPSVGDDAVPASVFVTQRGRRVRKGRHRRSPWTSLPRVKRQRVETQPAAQPQPLPIVPLEGPTSDGSIFDPLSPIPQSELEDFRQWMVTGVPQFIDLAVVEADRRFFEGILGETSWLDGEVFHHSNMLMLYFI
jgi:hypothetical protein